MNTVCESLCLCTFQTLSQNYITENFCSGLHFSDFYQYYSSSSPSAVTSNNSSLHIALVRQKWKAEQIINSWQYQCNITSCFQKLLYCHSDVCTCEMNFCYITHSLFTKLFATSLNLTSEMLKSSKLLICQAFKLSMPLSWILLYFTALLNC
jgi:hypothetical protein